MTIKDILRIVGTLLLGIITFVSGFLGGFLALLLAIIVAGVGVTAFTGNENWTSKICTILSFALAFGGVIINLLLLMEIIPPFIV